jgi:hypothetical protein
MIHLYTYPGVGASHPVRQLAGLTPGKSNHRRAGLERRVEGFRREGENIVDEKQPRGLRAQLRYQSRRGLRLFPGQRQRAHGAGVADVGREFGRGDAANGRLQDRVLQVQQGHGIADFTGIPLTVLQIVKIRGNE